MLSEAGPASRWNSPIVTSAGRVRAADQATPASGAAPHAFHSVNERGGAPACYLPEPRTLTQRRKQETFTESILL